MPKTRLSRSRRQQQHIASQSRQSLTRLPRLGLPLRRLRTISAVRRDPHQPHRTIHHVYRQRIYSQPRPRQDATYSDFTHYERTLALQADRKRRTLCRKRAARQAVRRSVMFAVGQAGLGGPVRLSRRLSRRRNYRRSYRNGLRCKALLW